MHLVEGDLSACLSYKKGLATGIFMQIVLKERYRIFSRQTSSFVFTVTPYLLIAKMVRGQTFIQNIFTSLVQFLFLNVKVQDQHNCGILLIQLNYFSLSLQMVKRKIPYSRHKHKKSTHIIYIYIYTHTHARLFL